MNNIQAIKKHIRLVRKYLGYSATGLIFRGLDHDKSKLEAPEILAYKNVKSAIYGTKEYESILKKIRPALIHHYKANRHHPQHFKNGISGMTLLDLIEMACDWFAAIQRKDIGTQNINKSLRIAQKKFKIDRQLMSILVNTMRYLGGAK